MSIVHFDGNLAEYIKKYPAQLVVQTRTKSDLMITARARGSNNATSVFIPKTLPTDVTRQAPAITVTQSDDFLNLLARKVIILVVPDPKLEKFLNASDNRLRAITGRDKLDLASIDELATAAPGDEAPSLVIGNLTITNVSRLNLIYEGKDEYGTIDEGEAILLDALLSCTEAEKQYIRANFKFKDKLDALWAD